jgi:hypothetical protein
MMKRQHNSERRLPGLGYDDTTQNEQNVTPTLKLPHHFTPISRLIGWQFVIPASWQLLILANCLDSRIASPGSDEPHPTNISDLASTPTLPTDRGLVLLRKRKLWRVADLVFIGDEAESAHRGDRDEGQRGHGPVGDEL